MSANEILASNLWPWPDPLMKRGRDGSIMFVNAAFLQLYGGRAQDWSGHVIDGWPAPAQQGAQRFETRAGEPGNEDVYDWVEMVMADGNAMAIARNVTALLTQTPPPADQMPADQMPVEAAPAQQAVASTPPPVETAIEQQPAQQTPMTQPVAEPAPALDTSAQSPAPQTPQPVEDGARAHEPQMQAAPQADAYADISAETHTEAHAEIQSEVEPAPQIQPTLASPPAEEAPRMIERRALPIEDSSAVLGSNWRDQVIAKAIGAEEVAEDTAPAPAPTASPAETEPEVETTTQSGDGLTILLAEDNAINALLTRTLLEAEGSHVDVVEDGSLAVEAMKTNRYDLIFMDMRMPVMDGLEATRKIRAMGAKLPIIALTANAFDDDRNACFDSGMNDFMTKPVSAEELSEMVINWTKPEEKKLAS